MLFAPGNHDEYHVFDRQEVARLFGDPTGEDGHSTDALWFATDVGSVRIVVLDTGTDLLGDGDPMGDRQLAWLDRTLMDADARRMRPLVVTHIPPYSSNAVDPPPPSLGEKVARGVLARHKKPPWSIASVCRGLARASCAASRITE
jgi:hypothetical protein